MAQITVLRDGCLEDSTTSYCRAKGTISLIQSLSHATIVDTGDISDSDRIREALNELGLAPYHINYVIHTHNHPDHTGNARLFERALVIEANSVYSVAKPDSFSFRDPTDIRFDRDIEIIRTPGHSASSESLGDLSVIVKLAPPEREIKPNEVAIVGDLFWTEEDYRNKDSDIYKACCDSIPVQMESRARIIDADYYAIIPGHGPAFIPRRPELHPTHLPYYEQS